MILENKLGITDPVQFADAEERISKGRAREIFDLGLLGKFDLGTFKGLSEIHKYLLGDIYDFAGTIRTVDIAKGNVRFVPVEGIGTALKFADIMPSDTFDDIVDKYIEWYIIHPFREGNGRALRIWLNIMLSAKIKAVVDYTQIPKENFITAMEVSPTNDRPIHNHLRRALTDDLGRAMYMKGIDASFAYEGLTKYETAKQ